MAPPPRPRIEREAAAAAREAGEIDDECFKPRNSPGRSSVPYQQHHQQQQKQPQPQPHHNHPPHHNQRYSNHYHSNSNTSNQFQRRGGGISLPPRQSHLSNRSVVTSNSTSISTSSYADLARTDPPIPSSRATSSAASSTPTGSGVDSGLSHAPFSSATNGLANRWQSTTKLNGGPPEDRPTTSSNGDFRATESSRFSATLAPRGHGSMYDEEGSIDNKSDFGPFTRTRDISSSSFGRDGGDRGDRNSSGRRAGRWDGETRGVGGRRSFGSRGGNRSRGDGFRGRTGRYGDISVYSSSSLEADTYSTPLARAGEVLANRESFPNSNSSARSFEFRGRGVGDGHRSGRGRFDRGTSGGGRVSRSDSPPMESLQALKRIRGPTNSFGSEGEILSDAELSPKCGTKPYWRQDNDDVKPSKSTPLSFERQSMPTDSRFTHSSSTNTKANESAPNSSIARLHSPQILVPPSQPTVLRSYGSLAGDEALNSVKPVPEQGGQYSAMDRTITDKSVVRDRSDFQRSSGMESDSMTSKGSGWIDRRSNPDLTDVNEHANKEVNIYQRSALMEESEEMKSQERGDWVFRGRVDRGRSGRNMGGRGFGSRGGEVGRRGGRFPSLVGGERAARGRGYHGRGDFNRGDGGRGNRVISNRRSGPSDEMESSWKTDQRYAPYGRDIQQQQPPIQPSFKSYADAPFFTPRDANVGNQSGMSSSYPESRPHSPYKPHLSISPPPLPSFASMSAYSLTDGVDKPIPNIEVVVKTETMEETNRLSPPPLPPPPPPCPPSPPPPEPKEPSGLVLAITRLADLEAQMEYEYAKHLFLARRQAKLRAEYKVLEKQPVGMDSFQEEYDAYMVTQVSSNEAS